jgi:hypothetical protein
MSQTAAGLPFSEAEKVDIRRFCGYPAYGAGPAGFQGFRFFQAYGLLEFRMNNLAPAEYATVRGVYLAELRVLEAQIPASAANLDTESAGPWVHNPKELAEREALFRTWRLALCGFLGLPPGPALGGSALGLALIV